MKTSLGGDEWWAWHPVRFTPGQTAPNTPWRGDLLGSRTGLESVEKRKILSRVLVTKTMVWMVNRFIESSLTTISSYTLKITVTIAHVTSHTKFSNSSSGHTDVPLELRNSSEVSSHSRIFSYPLGMDHAQKTQFYCCLTHTTQKTSHVIAISPVHWCADCCLATSYKHSSCCCVRVLRGIYPAVYWQWVDMSQYLAPAGNRTSAIQPVASPHADRAIEY
jgi:hypothetical protein